MFFFPNLVQYISVFTSFYHPKHSYLVTMDPCECDESRKRESDTMRFVRILIAPAATFGTSFAFALQMVLLTPALIDLGVARSAVSLVWLVGPLSGLVVQPVVGYLSDEYHKMHATRLPLIIVSSGVLIASHLGIACNGSMAWGLGINPLWILVFGFLILDSANNAILVTMRAMLSDRFGREHRTFAFSVLQFWTSFGYIVGYLVATGERTDSVESKLFSCFAISGVMVFVSTLLSFFSVYEKRACRAKVHGPHTGEAFCMGGLFINPSLVSIAAGSILTWFGWFAQQIYQTDFISSEIIARVDPTKLGIWTDVSGIQISALGLLISSVLSCVSGLLLPVMLSYIGYDSVTLFRVWSIATLFQSLVLLSSVFVETIAGAVVWEAAVGPMFAIACTVPYMLVANNCDHGCSGRVMAFVNVTVCFPQMVVSLLGGVLVKVADTDIVLFVIGGLLCGLAAWLLWVPEGFAAPPWSEASAASLIASTSDIFAPAEIVGSNGAFDEIRLRGLSTPKIPHMESSLSFPLLHDVHN
jgi:hypothetical protein